MVGLILAAGNGQRLAASGIELCKPLIEIAGKSLIEYSLENLFALKAEKVFIVVGKYKNEIQAKIGKEYKDIPIEYAVQREPRGLVNAMAAALPLINDDVILQLSDEIFIDTDTPSLLDAYGAADFICGVTEEDDAEKIRGNYSVELGKNGEIVSCTEKPEIIINNLKGTGFCIFSRECIGCLKELYDEEKNVPADLCDFINLLVKEGYRGAAAVIGAREYNVNTALDAKNAKAELE